MLEAIVNNIKFTGVAPNSLINTVTGGTSNNVTIPQNKPDEFVKQNNDNNKKKQLSNSTKIGIGVGIAALTTIAFFVAKGRSSEAKNLAEHLEFKPAQTVKDAIKFGKENLGIKSYNDFGENDLAVLNWLNEAFVNVSNKMNGKLRMPKHVIFTDNPKILGENTMAGVVLDQNLPKDLKKYSGYFYVNKKFFKDPVAYVNSEINKFVKLGYLEKSDSGKFELCELYSAETKNIFSEIMKDFQKNKSFNSAVRLSNALENVSNASNSLEKNPLDTIKVFLKDKELCNRLRNSGLNTNLEEIKKLPQKEQTDLRDEMYNVLEGKNAINYVNDLIAKDKEYANKLVEKGFIEKAEPIKTIKLDKLFNIVKYTGKYTGEKVDFSPLKLTIRDFDKTTPFSTIYHEMGHLQDMKPRCNATQKYDYDYSKYPQELKDWVDNEENIRIANKVSAYSTHGPGEFIAETFAKLIEGRKLSQEVMDLYRKLEGPAVPNM